MREPERGKRGTEMNERHREGMRENNETATYRIERDREELETQRE